MMRRIARLAFRHHHIKIWLIVRKRDEFHLFSILDRSLISFHGIQEGGRGIRTVGDASSESEIYFLFIAMAEIWNAAADMSLCWEEGNLSTGRFSHESSGYINVKHVTW
jgi:hypothetical protein